MEKNIEEEEFEEINIVMENDDLPMFKHFPELSSRFHRVELVDHPTPVHELEYVSNALERDVLIKRDDLTTHTFGGNKPRKYEFILGDILKRKRKVVTTVGALGSNHCFGFALLARQFGIKVRLYILDQPLIPEIKENLLRRCHPHLFLEPGASDNLGVLGYINAGFEFYEQVKGGECEDVDYIYVPLGTAGTAVGLLIGLELAYGRGKGPKIVAVSVLDSFVNKNWMMKSMCKKAVQFLQKSKGMRNKIPNIHEYMFERLRVNRDFLGKTYGHPTTLGMEAIDLVGRDNIKLDKIYTGKAFSCLINECNSGKVKDGERVMFWMTKNSADLSKYTEGKKGNWKTLPNGFHKFFNGERKYVTPTKIKLKKE